MKAALAILLCSLTFVPAGSLASRPPPFVPVVPDTTPAISYDPELISRVGEAYAHRFDFSSAFTAGANARPPVTPSNADLRRLRLRFSSAVDDAARERIIATIANGDATRAAQFQKLFANDEFLNHATEAIRVFGLHETDLADVTSALLIAGYNASHPVALTAAAGLGLARNVRADLLASVVVPTLDDAAKQTIATEMSYQVLFWEFDASLFGDGQNPASFARLHESIRASFATLGVSLDAIRPTDTGIEMPQPQPAR